jgi:glycosyltransferase involved in cell wall biosynthesis
MKVLHVYKSYYPEATGGIETYIDHLTNEISKKGVENHLLTTTKSSKAYTKKLGQLHVHYFPALLEFAATPISFSLLRNARALMKQFDLIHFHLPWPCGDLVSLLCPKRIPSVVTYHSDIIRQKKLKYIYAPLMHVFLRRMNVILPTSENYVKTSVVLKRYVDKCHVVPIGIHDSLNKPLNAEKLDHWKKKVGENFLFFLGVLRYYKGLDYLLEAMVDTDIPLVIAGSGPEKEKLIKKAKDLKLTNVIFVGYVDEVDKGILFQLSKAVVIPSQFRSEAFCISLAEGLMYGKPLISTELGTGTSFVNKDKVTGFVVQPMNVSELKAAILSLFADEKQYEAFSKAARGRYLEHFTVESMAESVFEVYQRLLADCAKKP